MNEELDKAYEEALEASRRRGATDELPPEQERRAAPRIRISMGSIKAGIRAPNYMIDISVSGAGICFGEPAREGDIIHIFTGNEEAVPMSVVNCRFSEFDHDSMVTHYRLNCVAQDQTEGKRLFVYMVEHGDEGLRLERPQAG